MPFGLMMVVPLNVPTSNPGDGTVMPTISVPAFRVGARRCCLAPAVVAAIRLTASALADSARTSFFTLEPPGG